MTKKPPKPIKVTVCENCHRGFLQDSKYENLLMSIDLFSRIVSSETVDISEEHLRRIEKQLGIIDRSGCARSGEKIKLQETGEKIMANLDKRIVCGYCENLFWKMWLIRLRDAGKPSSDPHPHP